MQSNKPLVILTFRASEEPRKEDEDMDHELGIFFINFWANIWELKDIYNQNPEPVANYQNINASNLFVLNETTLGNCTTESGASPNLPCVFPFRFNGVTHTTCTWDMAHLTEHKPWCSTLVDEVGHHVGGQSNWGNCGPDCPISPDNRNETTKVTGR